MKKYNMTGIRPPNYNAYIHNIGKVPLYNITHKSMSALEPKGVYLYGLNKSTGKYIVHTGNMMNRINVSPDKISFKKPNFNKVCKKCSRKISKLTLNEVMSIHSTNPINKFSNTNTYVNQDEYTISPLTTINGKTIKLYTLGLATCTALGFTIGNKKVLTHLSSQTDIKPIIKDILEQTKHDKYVKNITISCGIGGDVCDKIKLYNPSSTSFKLAKNILRKLKHAGKIIDTIKIEYVCYAEIIEI